MSERQEDWKFNSPATNFAVVSAIILGSVVIGFLYGGATNDFGVFFTWIVLGLGFAAIYLLLDLANVVVRRLDRGMGYGHPDRDVVHW